MTIVFKVSENVKQKIIQYYKDLKRDKTPPYAIFQADEADTIITLYESSKIMFQGISADIDANIWIEMERKLNNRIIDITGKDKKEKDKKEKEINDFFKVSSIGSDEVGTGDFFGPIVVSAAYIAKEQINWIKELGVLDSKKLTDDKIIKIAKELIQKIPYTTITLKNEDYNKYQAMGYNMNKIKAILHNKVLFEMKKKNLDYDKIVVDQFVYPKKYYEHINESLEKVTNITFTTKAESKYASVAAASCISRYFFLVKMHELSQLVKKELPKGAGALVDEVGAEIIKTHGNEILNQIAKLNFKNMEKIKAKL